MNKKLKLLLINNAILFLTLFLVAGLDADNYEELKTNVLKKEDKVKSINEEIEKRKKKIEILEDKELSLIDEIYNLERTIERESDELKRTGKSIKKVEVNLDKIDKEIVILEVNKEKLENSIKGRLNAVYKTRRGGILKVLFSTDDLNDLGRNLYYIKSLINYDMLLFNEFKENSIRLEDGRERLRHQKKEFEDLSIEYKSRKSLLLQQKNKRRSIIKKVRKEEVLELASIKELESAASELQELLINLRKRVDEEERKNVDNNFALMKGRLEMPVDGKIISFFGKIKHPKFKTVTFNKGVEILAPVGSEVSAVFEGEVVYSGWFKGYGKMMIVDHRNGYFTLLAHLSETLKSVGEKVNKGEVVALVGDTGSLKGPMLYFEVRYHGEPRDPLDWIVKK